MPETTARKDTLCDVITVVSAGRSFAAVTYTPAQVDKVGRQSLMLEMIYCL